MLQKARFVKGSKVQLPVAQLFSIVEVVAPRVSRALYIPAYIVVGKPAATQDQLKVPENRV